MITVASKDPEILGGYHIHALSFAKTLIYSWISKLNLPIQESRPSPDKPGLHVQAYDPGLLSHVAFSSQVDVF